MIAGKLANVGLIRAAVRQACAAQLERLKAINHAIAITPNFPFTENVLWPKSL